MESVTTEAHGGDRQETKEKHQRLLRGIGNTLIWGGLIGAITVPIGIVWPRADQEEAHGAEAQSEVHQAIFELGGYEVVDSSSTETLLFDRFTDNDTLVIQTGEPDPVAARIHLVNAAQELDGTYKNQAVADELNNLLGQEYLEISELVGVAANVDTEVANGEMLFGNDYALAGAALLAMGAGIATLRLVPKSQEN